MGPTDFGWQYCGWNIDDVEVVGCACDDPLIGDLDRDGDVDVRDLELLADCLGGPDVAYTPECAVADLTADAQVDLMDFALLQAACDGLP
jgi:hypothetical protein